MYCPPYSYMTNNTSCPAIISYDHIIQLCFSVSQCQELYVLHMSNMFMQGTLGSITGLDSPDRDINNLKGTHR